MLLDNLVFFCSQPSRFGDDFRWNHQLSDVMEQTGNGQQPGVFLRKMQPFSHNITDDRHIQGMGESRIIKMPHVMEHVKHLIGGMGMLQNVGGRLKHLINVNLGVALGNVGQSVLEMILCFIKCITVL